MKPDRRTQPTRIGIVLISAWLSALGGLAWALGGAQDGPGAGHALMGYGLGVLGGMLGMHFWSAGAARRQVKAMSRVKADLHDMSKAFGIMRQQLAGSVSSSEAAVTALVERLNRVHGNVCDLQAQANEAVLRSQNVVTESVGGAQVWGQAAVSLSRHLAHSAQMQAECSSRLSDAAARVKSLAPMLDLVSEVARQTNVLAINAAIEAARAGPEGVSFKVVAAEVRRLSSRSAQAAGTITDGVASAANSLELQVAAVASEDANITQAQSSLASQQGAISSMSESLSRAASPLAELSGAMQFLVERVLVDIVEALGDMQFQDVTRQVIEQVDNALADLSGYARQPPLSEGAEEGTGAVSAIVAGWQRKYVMEAQRQNHEVGVSAAVETFPASGGAIGSASRVELF